MKIMKTIKKRKTPKFGGHSQAQVLDTIQGCYGFVSQIATTLGVDISTVSNWKIRYVWVEKAFENAEMEMGDFAENQLYKLIQKENPAAVFFYLKTKCKNRGYIERQERTGTDGKPVTIIVEYEDGPKSKS